MNIKKVIMPFVNPYKSIIDKLFKPIYSIRRKPFSLGYNSYKWHIIKENINNDQVLGLFSQKKTPKHFGIGVDERVVEYPWIFSNLPGTSKTILDAGSTFNFKPIVEHKYFKDKQLNIYTFYPEAVNFPSDIVSYQYGDLRSMPYDDNCFDVVVCHSTIEHIDMDNSIYGYEIPNKANIQVKSFEFIKAINEMQRVLKKKGTYLLTFPFGVFKNYGFFQQFDSEMRDRITNLLSEYGQVEINYILYSKDGWNFSDENKCNNSLTYNPHTGEDKGVDGAAHSRCVCCIKFVKN